jgi:hypothetical protein
MLNQTDVREAGVRMGAAARAFLARGRLARLSASALVTLAAVVWLGAFVVVLRVVAVVVLSAATVWCVWLVVSVWRGGSPDQRSTLGSLARSRLARVIRGADDEPRTDVDGEPRPQAADLIDIRRSVDALGAEFAACREHVHRDLERWQRELGSQIAALRDVVDGVPIAERTTAPEESITPPQPAWKRDVPELGPEDPDGWGYRAALAEIESDLRQEELDQREQMLADREERLDRRERELSLFVSQAQAQLR